VNANNLISFLTSRSGPSLSWSLFTALARFTPTCTSPRRSFIPAAWCVCVFQLLPRRTFLFPERDGHLLSSCSKSLNHSATKAVLICPRSRPRPRVYVLIVLFAFLLLYSVCDASSKSWIASAQHSFDKVMIKRESIPLQNGIFFANPKIKGGLRIHDLDLKNIALPTT
jgi:hypothetical protein